MLFAAKFFGLAWLSVVLLIFGTENRVNSNAWPDQAKPTSMTDIDKDIKAFIRRYVHAATDRQRLNATIDMCKLNVSILNDGRFPSVKRLRGLRAKLVHRLKTVQKDIAKAEKNRERIAKSKALAAESDTKGDSHDLGDLQTVVSPGAQRLEELAELSSVLSQQMMTFVQYTGGPSQISVHAGSYGGDAEGRQLVNLIETTINSDHWDTNGGNGHIHFYRPLCVLVISADMVTHDKVTHMLELLRSLQ